MGNYSLGILLHKILIAAFQQSILLQFVKKIISLTSTAWTLLLFSCTLVKTQHHITLDHNITIKIEKEVNSFLDDLYEDESTD